jgi:hypothetical protein
VPRIRRLYDGLPVGRAVDGIASSFRVPPESVHQLSALSRPSIRTRSSSQSALSKMMTRTWLHTCPKSSSKRSWRPVRANSRNCSGLPGIERALALFPRVRNGTARSGLPSRTLHRVCPSQPQHSRSLRHRVSTLRLLPREENEIWYRCLGVSRPGCPRCSGAIVPKLFSSFRRPTPSLDEGYLNARGQNRLFSSHASALSGFAPSSAPYVWEDRPRQPQLTAGYDIQPATTHDGTLCYTAASFLTAALPASRIRFELLASPAFRR